MNGRDASRETGGTILLGALFLIAAVAFRLGIAGRALWFDERFTLAHTTALSDALLYCREDVHPPLYFVLVTLWRHLFPSTLFSLRILSLLFGIGSLAGIYLVGRRIAGPRAGLAALAVAALSPYHALYSTELRPYPLVLAFSSLSIWAFLDLVETGARRSYALFSIATILNLYTHYFTLFLLLSQIVLWGAIFAGRLRREGRTGEEKSRLLLAGASLLFLFIAFLPWVPHLTGLFSKSVLLGETVGAGGRIGGGVTWRLIGRSLYEALGQGPLPLAAEAILVVVAVARVRSRAASLLFVSIWTVPFLLLALGKPSHFLASKYFLYAYPLGVSLAAAGLGAGEGIVRPRRTAALPSLALIVLLAALPLLPGQHPAYAFHRTDWRRVAASVEARIGPGDWISFAGDQKSYCMLGEYAPEGFLRAHRMLGWNRSALTLPAALKEAGTRLWIVRQGPPPESLVSALGGGIVPVETWALYPRAVTLFRWEASGRRLPSE